MVKLSERADSLERLLESIVTMLGKSNERVENLNRRLTNLEGYVLQSRSDQAAYRQVKH